MARPSPVNRNGSIRAPRPRQLLAFDYDPPPLTSRRQALALERASAAIRKTRIGEGAGDDATAVQFARSGQRDRRLRERLARTRFPDSTPGDPWLYGTSVDYLRSLVEYWRGPFDWRRQEARLNAFPQFKVARPDHDLHFAAGRLCRRAAILPQWNSPTLSR